MEEFDSIFLEKALITLPLNYRFMVKKLTYDVGELRMRSRFSKSDSHRSWQYLNVRPYKPYSSILIQFEPNTNGQVEIEE